MKKKTFNGLTIDRSEAKKGPICICGNNMYNEIRIKNKPKYLNKETYTLIVECTKCKKRTNTGQMTYDMENINEKKRKK